MNIQNVSNVPSHIDEFLKGNNEKLTEKITELEKRLRSEKKHSKMLSEHP